MSLVHLPHELLNYIIYFLEGDDLFRLISSCKLMNIEFNDLLKYNKNYKSLNIFLQVDTCNLLYREYSFVLTRSGNILKQNIYNFFEDMGGETNNRMYSYTNICYNKNIRNIRLYKSKIYYTKIINNNYIKISHDPYRTTRLPSIIEHISDDKCIYPVKNIYYIFFNSNSRSQSLSWHSTYKHIYDEWDFNGVYICNSIDELLDSLIPILKRGISRIYKWLSTNTYDSVTEYVNELMKYTSKRVITFIKQIRYARIHCNRKYKVNLVNRWKPIYEYGNNRLGMGSTNVFEITRDGVSRPIKTRAVFDIKGIQQKKRDTTTRITEYFS